MGEIAGVHPQTAYRWFREGMLPEAAQRSRPRMILVNIDVSTTPEVAGGLGGTPACSRRLTGRSPGLRPGIRWAT